MVVLWGLGGAAGGGVGGDVVLRDLSAGELRREDFDGGGLGWAGVGLQRGGVRGVVGGWIDDGRVRGVL